MKQVILADYTGTTIEKSFSTSNDLEKGATLHPLLQNALEKGGEGSKGGKIIGHTKSGKPIYENANHPEHANFTRRDHSDAANKNIKLANGRYRSSYYNPILRASIMTDKDELHNTRVSAFHSHEKTAGHKNHNIDTSQLITHRGLPYSDLNSPNSIKSDFIEGDIVKYTIDGKSYKGEINDKDTKVGEMNLRRIGASIKLNQE
jgi:hypothetical protein